MRFAPAHQTVATVFDIAMCYTAQESGKESNMQIVAVERIERTNSIFKLHIENTAKLFIQIDPFAHAQKMHAVLVAELAELIPRLSIPFRTKGVPHRHVNEKIAFVTAEFSMQLADASAFGFFVRHHARILDAERRTHNQCRLQNAHIARTEQHRRKRNVHRELRHFATELCHVTARIVGRERPKFE